MAHEQVIQLPKFVETLLAALEQRWPGSETDVERVEGADAYYYRIALLSDAFNAIPLMERQDLVWAVAHEVLSHEERFRISMFLVLTPAELNGEDEPE